ncbi:MAG: LamG domain-containing protein [Chloroflexi bacterium]|nr:LamG domain-containing protein [Chloroflexota bacterium]
MCRKPLYIYGTSITPTPLPMPTAEPTVSPFLFSDDFFDPNSGWEISTGDVSVLGYTDGEYFIRVVETGWFVWSNGPSAVYRDAQISVSARQLSADYSDILFGIMCNFQDNQHYYYMGIDTQGYYGIGKRDGENDTLLSSNGQISYSDKLAQGGNWYNLTAACAGGALTLYVDGVLIDSAADSEYTEGNIGLFADVYPPSSGDPNQPMFLEMRYDNLVVAAPP